MLCSDVDAQRETLRRRLNLLPGSLISEFNLPKALLHGLELPGMASTIPRRATINIKRIIEKFACWLTPGYGIPAKPRCGVFTKDYLEILSRIQLNIATIGAFVEL